LDAEIFKLKTVLERILPPDDSHTIIKIGIPRNIFLLDDDVAAYKI
jgi:hypothetical protein